MSRILYSQDYYGFGDIWCHGIPCVFSSGIRQNSVGNLIRFNFIVTSTRLQERFLINFLDRLWFVIPNVADTYILISI